MNIDNDLWIGFTNTRDIFLPQDMKYKHTENNKPWAKTTMKGENGHNMNLFVVEEEIFVADFSKISLDFLKEMTWKMHL